MCHVLVSCADFEAIPTPFSEIIRNRCLSSEKKGWRVQILSLGSMYDERKTMTLA